MPSLESKSIFGVEYDLPPLQVGISKPQSSPTINIIFGFPAGGLLSPDETDVSFGLIVFLHEPKNKKMNENTASEKL